MGNRGDSADDKRIKNKIAVEDLLETGEETLVICDDAQVEEKMGED